MHPSNFPRASVRRALIATLGALLLGCSTDGPPTTPCTVAGIAVTPNSGQLNIGDTRNLSASISQTGCANATPSWQSSQPDVVSVSSNGLSATINALKPGGPVSITASYNSMSGAASFMVGNPPAPVATVAMTPASLSLTVGATGSVTAQPRDAQGNALSGRTVTWASSNPNVAMVSETGLVNAIAAGQTDISATSEGIRGVVPVTVTPLVTPVASVSVTPPSATLNIGQTIALSAVPRDAQGNALAGRQVVWISANPSVATVSSTGVVTAVGQGSAQIEATSEGRVGASAITVLPPASATVRLVFTNELIYPATIYVNGVAIGTVAAQSTQQATVNAAAAMRVLFTVVQPVVGGRSIGDPMSGYWDLINPTGTETFTIDNYIGGQFYFVPVITNTTGINLLMAVNFGLQAENRCNCTVASGVGPVAIGYYRLYSNSVVAAFRDGTNYTGSYRYYNNFGTTIPRGSGRADFLFTIAP